MRGTGTFTEWAAPGKKLAETSFKQGRRHGVRRVWTEAGILTHEESYYRGDAHGPAIRWTPDGALVSRLRFRFGASHGLQVPTHDDDGKPSASRCHDRGRLLWRAAAGEARPCVTEPDDERPSP